jgi:heterotetrameric sarcosine oxidase delta subunit
MVSVDCPNCGPRNILEFRYGGEYNPRPPEPLAADQEEWTDYIFMQNNTQGQQKEWWYHRAGCQLWFLAERNTKSNVMAQTYYWEATQTDSDQG